MEVGMQKVVFDPTMSNHDNCIRPLRPPESVQLVRTGDLHEVLARLCAGLDAKYGGVWFRLVEVAAGGIWLRTSGSRVWGSPHRGSSFAAAFRCPQRPRASSFKDMP